MTLERQQRRAEERAQRRQQRRGQAAHRCGEGCTHGVNPWNGEGNPASSDSMGRPPDGGLPDREQVSTYRERGFDTQLGAKDGPRFSFLPFHKSDGAKKRSAFAWCWDESGGFWSEEAEFQRPAAAAGEEPEDCRWEEPKTRGGLPPQPQVPGYIRNCSNNPGRKQRWYANLWGLSEPSLTVRMPYACNSWRCVVGDGGCTEHQRHVLYSRLEEAFEGVPAREVVMMVLTLDAPLHGLGDAEGQPTEEQAAIYRSMQQRTRGFVEGLRRLIARICTRCETKIGRAPKGCTRGNCECTRCLGCHRQPARCHCLVCSRCGEKKGRKQRCRRCDAALPERMKPFEREWFNVTEAHGDGTPHINYAIWSGQFAEFLRVRIRNRIKRGETGDRARYIAGWGESKKCPRDALDHEMMALLDRWGFGFASTAEPARNLEAVLNYGSKAAARADKVSRRIHQTLNALKRRNAQRRRDELDGAELPEDVKATQRAEIDRLLGELTKASQLPMNAPKGYRRLRSGPLFLPAVRKNPGYTGTVLRRSGFEDDDGVEVVKPLNAASKERDDLRLMQAFLADMERRLAWEDADALFSDLRTPGVPVQRERAFERWSHDLETLVRLGVFDAIDAMLKRRAAEAEAKAIAAAVRARQHRRPWAQRRLAQAERERAAIERARAELAATAAERERFLTPERQAEIAAARELEAEWFAGRS